MNLHDYLDRPGSLTVAQLRERIGAKSDAQIRQWRYEYGGRKPDATYAVRIEQVTGCVMRWDTRPDDWHQIWPELIGTKGAPPIAEPLAIGDAPMRRSTDRPQG